MVQPGRMPYRRAFAIQRALVERISRSGSDEPDTLFLLEHPPVITIGRRGTDAHVLATSEALDRMGVEVFETNRGGDVTFHGPGQMVGYPVFDLNRHGRDVHEHMRRQERAIISALADLGVTARPREGLTGVWVEDRKIASIGIAVTHWVAYHGFALNVDPDLERFGLIVPCGLPDVQITSIRKELGHSVAWGDVAERLISGVRREFGFEAEYRVELPRELEAVE